MIQGHIGPKFLKVFESAYFERIRRILEGALISNFLFLLDYFLKYTI